MAIERVQNLGTFSLPKREKLAVDVDRINGKLKVTFRVWYLDETDGEYKASRNGFSVDPDMAADIMKIKVPAEIIKQAAIEASEGNGKKAPATGGRKF